MSIKLHVTEVELCKYDIKSALDTIVVVLCSAKNCDKKKLEKKNYNRWLKLPTQRDAQSRDL